MKRKSKIIFLFSSVFIIMVCCSSVTVSAAPEDYINNFIDGISSAIDSFRDNNNSSSSSGSDTAPTEAPTETDPYESPTSAVNYYGDDTYDYDDKPYYNFATEPEESTEQSTYDIPQYKFDNFDEDEPDENYEYSYEPPTEEQTEIYEPEVLTETYTDPPFLERFSIADTGEGNLFVALGLWMSIIIGVIIVTSVVISTHRRKKGK